MKTKLHSLVVLTAVLFSLTAYSQEHTAGINTETPNPNAVLHLVSPDGDQGLLIPSLTTAERTAMTSFLAATDNGLMVFDSDDNLFYFWVNPNWIANTNSDNQNLTLVGNTLSIDNGNSIDLSSINTDNQNLTLTGTNLSLDRGNSVDLTTAGFLVTESDPTVPANIKDGVDFTELTGIPTNLDQDFTDDVVQSTLPATGDIEGNFQSGLNIAVGVVSALEIVDGTIDDNEISGSANIAASKLDGNVMVQGENVGLLFNDAGYISAETDPTVPANIKDGIDWSELTGIPTDFADGTDDGIITETDPVWTLDRTTIGSAGTINTPTNLLDWSQLKNVPADFADGTDDGIATETDPTVPANIKDGIDWSELTGIPTDFADGTDDGIITETDPVWTLDRTTIGSAGTINTPTNLLDWSQLKNVPADFADGTDDGIVTETDPTVPANIKDGIDWSELTGIPTDFADGTDDGIITETDPVWTLDRTTIGSAGTINTPTNLLDWSQLKNVPADFADGTDDGIVTETDPTVPANIKDGIDWSELTGIPTDFADGTDDGIITETDPVWTLDRTTIGSAGTINTPTNLLDWSQLKNVPADFADGTDDGIVTETDPTVPANIKDGIDWSELTGIPTDFADGTDDGIITETDPVWTLDRTTIGSAGTINTPTNLLDWSQLKNVPADFADGTDDGIVTETDPTVPANIKDGIDWSELTGIPTDFADGTDDGIITETDPVWTLDRTTIGSAGTINTPTNLLDWSQLKNVPADFADGTDDGIATETDPTVPANIKDGIDWSELTGIPTDFADGTDDGIITETDPVWTLDRTTIGSAGTINTPTNLLDWSQLKNVPADFADGTDDGIVTETDPTVPANIKDGIDWSELSGIPAGFSDDVDDGILLVTSNTTLNGDGNGTPLGVNVGTGAGQIVQLDGSGFLPAVDANALTNLSASSLSTVTTANTNDILTFNGSTWDAAAQTSILSGGNGIEINTNSIDLGGNLTAPAIINTGAGSNDLTIAGAGSFIANPALSTSFQSPIINLGNEVSDAVNVVGSMSVNENILFNEATHDLALQVDDQSTGLSTLIIPNLDGNTEVIALQSDLGSFIDINDNNLAGNSLAAPTGSDNVVLGTGSGSSISTGSDNIIIGTSADNTSATTGGNVAIGNVSDASGGDAIALGTNSVASAQNAVAIGTFTEANIPNTIVLGDGINSDFFVGIGVQDVRVPLQVGGELGFGHFQNSMEGIEGDAILSNAYPDYSDAIDNTLRRTNTDSVAFIFLDDGKISFLNAPGGGVNSPIDISNGGEVRNWMEMQKDGNISIDGGFVLGDPGPAEEKEGMIRWTGANFQGNTNGTPGGWVNLDGAFTLPYSSSVGDGATLLDIEQTGAGRVAEFAVVNSTHNNPALEVRSNGDGATSYLARFDRTFGSTGSGVFIDMNSVNNPAILIDNTTAPIQIFDGASDGHVLTSDVNGIGTWQPSFGTRDAAFNILTPMSGSGGSLNLGGDNIFLGRTVGNFVDDGDGNVLIGSEVATALTGGGGNVSIGFQSGGGTLADGNDNIFIGTRAILAGGPANSTNNISIGTDASTTLGAIAIGANASATAPGSVAIGTGASATASNTVTLGNSGGTAYSLEVTGNTSIGGTFVSTVSTPVNDGFTPTTRIVRVAVGADISNIGGSTQGQEIILVTEGAATINQSASIDLTTTPMVATNAFSTLHLVFVGSRWVEISRSLK